MQKQNGAKHFDVEQVVLAAAVAAKDVATLKAEIVGPNASNLSFASQRLCTLAKKHPELMSSEALLEFLVSLPLKRRKPFIKSLIKERHTAVLDAYVTQHLVHAKDGKPRIAAILHGLSSALVQEHMGLMKDYESYICTAHLARYHATAWLNFFEAELIKVHAEVVAAKSDAELRPIACNKLTAAWSTFQTQLLNGNTAKNLDKVLLNQPVSQTDKTLLAKRVVALAAAYTPYKLHENEYYRTLPAIILKNFKFLADKLEAEIMDLTSICVRPFWSFHVYTFDLPVCSRSLTLKFLNLSVPKSVDLSVPEYSQRQMPSLFTAALNQLRAVSYWPEALDFAIKLKDWAIRRTEMYPAAREHIGSIYFQPLVDALQRARNLIQSNLSSTLETRRVLSEKLIKEERDEAAFLGDKKFVQKEVAQVLPSLGKLLDLSSIVEAEADIMNLFMAELKAETKIRHEKDERMPNHSLQASVESFHTFANSVLAVATQSPAAIKIALEYLAGERVWKNQATVRYFARIEGTIWKTCASFAFQIEPKPHSRVEIIKSDAWKAYESKRREFAASHVLSVVKHFATPSTPLDEFEASPEHPLSLRNMRRDFPNVFLPLAVAWSQVEPIYTLLYKPGTFVEMVKENNVALAISILKHLPSTVRAPVLESMMEAKVCTASQKTELVPLQTIAGDSRIRKQFETATSSSSPGERVASLIRLVRASCNFPIGSLESPYYCPQLMSETPTEEITKQRTLMLAETASTLSFIVKRIKNTLFQDRVLLQRHGFLGQEDDDEKKKVFASVWLAPGVNQTHFAIWLEMLDDHLQNPNQKQDNVEIEQPENYESALSPYGYGSGTESWNGYAPYAFWEYLAKRALSLGFQRQEAALIEFAIEIISKIGIVHHGASDPVQESSVALSANFIAGHLLNLNDAKKIDFALSTLRASIAKKYTDASLWALKESKLLRQLATETPVRAIERIPVLFDVVQKSIATLASQLPASGISITDITKPPTRTGFEEEEVLEEFERLEILPTLLAVPAAAKRAHRLPWLSDFVFNVALKSWAASAYLDVAWKIRLQSAFAAHKRTWVAAHPNDVARYPKPTGRKMRKIEAAASHAFAKEIVSICPSALHNKIFQRIIAHIDPTTFFSHLPTTQNRDLDTIEDETEKLEAMASAGLLGRFSPASNVTLLSRTPATRGRGGRASRGGRVPVSSRPVAVPASAASMSFYFGTVAQLSSLKNVTKTWRRSQSTKSSDNSNFFLPALCYGMEAWHPTQITAFGSALHAALLNPMRSQEVQKKFVILWTLLPTTNYADIVLFLQENDFNFFPSTEEEGAEEAAGEDEEKAEAPAAPVDSAPKPTLPLAVVEAAIHGTTMNDEPLAPLPFLLSPTFLSSSYSRVAIQAVQSLIKYAPEGLLTNALAYLLRDHRKKLKTTAHKQIIRFLASDVSEAHWDIFLAEWRHPRTHRDVRITLLQAAFEAISVAKDSTLEKVWQLLALAADYREPEVVAALLKVRPATAPSRQTPFTLDLSETLLNTRIKNQYESYTEIAIPNDCAARYMRTVMIPLLSRDDNLKQAVKNVAKGNEQGQDESSSMAVDEPTTPEDDETENTPVRVSNGSDLQFLAYASLIRWANYVNEATPGKPDYAAVAIRLIDYTVDSIKHDDVFVADQYKKMMTAVQRCIYFISNISWLLGYSEHSPSYAENAANTKLTEDEWLIPGAAQMLENMMTNLVHSAEFLALHEPIGPVSSKMDEWAAWIVKNESDKTARAKEKEDEKIAKKRLAAERKVAIATGTPVSAATEKAVADIDAAPKTVVEEEYLDEEYENAARIYRRLGNTLGAINSLIVALDEKAVARNNMSAEEQQAIYSSLFASRFCAIASFNRRWVTMEINQIDTSLGTDIIPLGYSSDKVAYSISPVDAFVGAYERVLRRVAATSENQSLASTTLASWCTSVAGKSVETGLTLLGNILDSFVERERTNTFSQEMPSIGSSRMYIEAGVNGFESFTPSPLEGKYDNVRSRVERALDVQFTLTIFNVLVSCCVTTSTRASDFWPKVVPLVNLVFKIICFELPGLLHLSEKVTAIMSSVLSQLQYDSYHVTATARKATVTWIIKSALDVLQNHPRTGSANRKYHKMWRNVLGLLNGSLFAKFAPEYCSRLIYFLAQEDDSSLDTWITSMLTEWTYPSNSILNPGLGGVGNREHDLSLATALVTDLINVRLSNTNKESALASEGEILAEDNFEFVDRLVSAAIHARSSLSALPKILFERNVDTYWKIFNTEVARRQFSGPHADDPMSASTLKSHLESVFTKDSQASNYTEKYDLKALLNTLEKLFGASFAEHGVAPHIAKHYPFAEVQLQYGQYCRQLALDTIILFGDSSAVPPPKGAASGKSIWRPEFTALYTRVLNSTDDGLRYESILDLALASRKF